MVADVVVLCCSCCCFLLHYLHTHNLCHFVPLPPSRGGIASCTAARPTLLLVASCPTLPSRAFCCSKHCHTNNLCYFVTSPSLGGVTSHTAAIL